MSLILPGRRYQQVQQAPRLSQSPLTRGLVAALVPIDGKMFDLVSGKFLTATNGPTRRLNQAGQNAYYTKASSQYHTGTVGPQSLSLSYTIAAVCTTDITTTQSAVAEISDATGSQLIALSNSNAGADDWYVTRTDGAAVVSAALGTSARVAGQPYRLVARASTNLMDIWNNGVKEAVNSTAGTDFNVAFTNIYAGARIKGGVVGNFHTGALGLVLFWNRFISDAEAKEWSANPWQVFSAPGRMWVPAAVATINQAVGPWSWAGVSGTIGNSAIIQTPGAWSWAGTNSTIGATGTVIGQAVGAWGWKGVPATFANRTAAGAGRHRSRHAKLERIIRLMAPEVAEIFRKGRTWQ